MGLFKVVVLAVLCGIASADLWDYNTAQTACLQAHGGQDMNYCDNKADLMACLKKAAEDTKVVNRNEVKAVWKTFEDLCTDGSESNKLFVANRQCAKDALTDLTKLAGCLKELADEVSKLTPQQQQDKKVLERLTCKHTDGMNNCMRNLVKEKCGENGVKLFNVMQDSSIKLLKQACIDSGNGAGIAAANMYFSIFQVLAALAMIKWFSH